VQPWPRQLLASTQEEEMSRHTLQQLVGVAVVDRHFCQSFLDGGRRELLAQFEMSPEEQEKILAIQADSLVGFAGELERWLNTRD
jgi:hypothetical protein